jgi:uncharacterized protein with HEPN domain
MKDNIVYIRHILDSIERINEYTKNVKYDDFIGKNLIQAAVIRELEIIGEASKKLTREFRIHNSDIQWKKIAGMGDKLIHDYFGIDVNSVWETVIKDIPELKEKLKKIKE